jgi:F-type H+-transporting ATPase subunit epsilon
MPFQVELVSPERTLLSMESIMVQARTLGGGDIAFLPGHAPFIGALATWTIAVRGTDGNDVLAAVHGGFIEVSDDNVKILSDLAELADDIDADRARRQVDEAEAKLRAGEDAEAEAELRRAHARLRAVDEAA